MNPKVAFIGTGGTISSLGIRPLDLQDYGATATACTPTRSSPAGRSREVADVIPVRLPQRAQHRDRFPEWQALALLCERLVAEHPDLAGIVIGHGTATLEETAYFLNLMLKVAYSGGADRLAAAVERAVDRCGAQPGQRVRVAAAPGRRGLGVLVVLNDEIQAAREVTKTSTCGCRRSVPPTSACWAMPTAMHRVLPPARAALCPDTEFDIRALEALPRVDIAYAYAGGDGTAVRAFTAAGAKGIVSAGFAPGFAPPADSRR